MKISLKAIRTRMIGMKCMSECSVTGSIDCRNDSFFVSFTIL